MKVLYLDCFSGISGDMLLGALIDLGARVSTIRSAVRGLGLDFSLSARRVRSHGISARKVRVTPRGAVHDRGFGEIRSLIERSALDTRAKEIALEAFVLLAEAESRVHACRVDDVRFHEVGAVDSIVDIVGTAVAVVELGVERVISSPLPMTRGFVRSRHGTLPLPAPATIEILKGVPTYGDPRMRELVTPTGAALVVALADEFGRFPRMTPERVGYGAGTSEDADYPNLLRAILGELEFGADVVWVVECDIDDQSPELFPQIMERLMDAGALDVTLAQAIGKKGRPKYVLSAIVRGDKRGDVVRAMLEHSSTLGARCYMVERGIMERASVEIEVDGVRVRMKMGISGGRIRKIKPEFDDLQRLAELKGIPLISAHQLAVAEASRRGFAVGKKI